LNAGWKHPAFLFVSGRMVSGRKKSLDSNDWHMTLILSRFGGILPPSQNHKTSVIVVFSDVTPESEVTLKSGAESKPYD
jgi:hypothetical protein